MATEAEATDYSSLVDKLAALEQKLAELEKKCSSTPLTAEGLAVLDKAKDIMKEKEQDAKPVDDAKATEKEPEDEGSDPRVKVVVRRRSTETGLPIEEDSKLQKSRKEDRKNRAFILRKHVWDDKYRRLGPMNNSEIEIVNPDLWNLLKKRLGHYPYHYFRDSPVTLSSPYEAIVFHFDELKDASQQSKEDESEADRLAREDLARLLNVISGGDSGDPNLDKYFKMRPNYKKPTIENEPETVQFQDLWTVFAPGTLIYGRPFQNEDQIFVVKDNGGNWPERSPLRTTGGAAEPWKLYAWTYDWKDGNFRRTDFLLQIAEFDGHLPLTSLPYYPFHLHPQYSAIREKLIARGKRFRQICEAKDGHLFEYDGLVISEHKGFSGMKHDNESGNASESAPSNTQGFSAFMNLIAQDLGMAQSRSRIPTAKSTKIRSRVMVDYDSYFQYAHSDGRNGALEPGNTGPGCLCSDCQTNEGLEKRYRFRFDKSSHRKEWEDEQYLICPPRVLGYVLADKEWAQLQVTKVTTITTGSTEGFTAEFLRLKLADDIDHDDNRARQGNRKRTDNSTKKLLLDLVRNHIGEREGGADEQELEVDDIIPEKGKGLVVLLYGPPGVGKTSTAEMIAMATQKPLFSVSVSDVGTEAKHVEANLSRIFALATKWEAILLIDEADVFLESRGRGREVVQPTDKNALVSVFLRVLEYYHGIMFLTTNQIAKFDIAIVSRIHVAICYESLRPSQATSIFRNFLDKLYERGAIEGYHDTDGITEWIDDISNDGLDGRQIRNIVTTALGLARAAKKGGEGRGKLTKEHLVRAHKNVNNFKNEFKLQMEKYRDSQERMIR